MEYVGGNAFQYKLGCATRSSGVIRGPLPEHRQKIFPSIYEGLRS